MKTEPNDAAFARPKSGNVIVDQLGLTQREYFAGLAMQGLLANGNHEFMTNIRRLSMVSHKGRVDGMSPANVLGSTKEAALRALAEDRKNLNDSLWA